MPLTGVVHSTVKGCLTANILCQETERKIRARVLWSHLGHTYNDLRACDPFLPLQSIITQLENVFNIWPFGDIWNQNYGRQTDKHGICIKENIPRYPNYLSPRAWASEFLLTNPDEFAFSSRVPCSCVPACLTCHCPVTVSCVVPAGLLPSLALACFVAVSSQQPGLSPLNLRSHGSSLLRTPLGLLFVLRLKSNGFIQACSGTERSGTLSRDTAEQSGWRL